MTDATRVCPGCDAPVTGPGAKLYCTRECGWRYRSRVRYQTDPRYRASKLSGIDWSEPRECAACGRPFTQTPKTSPHTRCAECRTVAPAKAWRLNEFVLLDRCILPTCPDCGLIHGGRPWPAPRRCRPCQYVADRARRNESLARRRAAERAGESIHWRELGERDGWLCHLCARLTHREHSLHDRSPTVDHLVPIAAGGTHTWDNVALACRACNIARRTGGAVQLRLIA